MSSRGFFSSIRKLGRSRLFLVGSVVGATAAGLYSLDVFNEHKFNQQMVGVSFELTASSTTSSAKLLSRCSC